MPDDENESSDEGSIDDASLDDGPETFEGEFEGGNDDPASGHSESVFIVDDELSGRESWLDRASRTSDLDDAEARATFAEEISLQADLAAVLSVDPSQVGETPEATEAATQNAPFVDADPGALDAASGLSTAATLEGETEPVEGETPRVDVMKRHLRGLLEALLFVTDRPIKVADLADVARADAKECRAILEELSASYRADARGFQLDELAGGWQLRTSATFAPFVREITAQKPVKLTRAQIETLAIIAYRQPVTRPEIEDVRGVDAGPVVKLLLERDLVRVLGKKDEPGRPLLYGTTGQFLQFFGLKSLRDLPTLREFTELSDESKETVERELGEVLPEGPKEPTAIGDASVAAADFDPTAPAEPETGVKEHAEPEAVAVAPVEAEAETETETEAETEAETGTETEAESEAESEAEAETDDDDGAEKGETPAGGSKYDPTDEELYPDDEDDDFDDDDDEDADDDEDEEDDDDDDEGDEEG